MEESEFEQVTPASPTFATGGAPFMALQLCVPHAYLDAPRGMARGPRELPTAVWAALDALGASTANPAIDDAFGALVRELVEAGVLASPALDDLTLVEPPHLARVWSVIARLYGEQDTSAYVAVLAAAAKLSVRQTERDLAELTRRFGLSGGFRATLKLLRLRRATMLLSAEDATVAGVARFVGYGSPDAMGRAFRDAGLPPPRDVRAHLTAIAAL